MSLKHSIIQGLGATALVVGLISSAHAQSLTATWFTVSSSDPDRPFPFDGGAVFSNEVMPNLGPDNLPVINTSYGGAVPQDLFTNGSVQEITWWSPAHDPNVTETGTSTLTVPINFPCTTSSNCVYPPNGTGTHDAGTAGYEAAIFSATLTPATTESVSFSIGADDVAFAYLNGKIVCDLGGTHPDTPGTCSTGTLTADTANSLEIFYADLRPAAAAFTFEMTTTNVGVCPPGTSGPNCTPVIVTSTPEPATFGLMSLALAGIGFARRRRAG